MDAHSPSPSLDDADAGVESRSVQVLEWLDTVAHVIVAVFFLVTAATVLVHTGLTLVRQLPLLAAAVPGISGAGPSPQADVIGGDPFFRTSLELLSSILFVVILLELLRTVITSLRTQNIQAVMREFLVVGIISSIRKILLVGAQSSLTGEKGEEFIKEATGTLLSIVGIALLVVALMALQRSYSPKER